MTQQAFRSDISWSNEDSVTVHGHDLCRDLIGKVSFGDMAFLCVAGRLPKPQESRMFEAMLVALVEHGIVPSTLAARMTYAGAPESVQSAVAAGLLGLGNRIAGSTDAAARMLETAWNPRPSGNPPSQKEVQEKASRIVQDHTARGVIIPGVGHPIHTPVDPRAMRLFEIAQANGFHGAHVRLMLEISRQAQAASGKSLPVNVTGAIAAVCCEMELTGIIPRGMGIMSRAVGLVGHLLEEQRHPLAMPLWRHADEEASRHQRGPGSTQP